VIKGLSLVLANFFKSRYFAGTALIVLLLFCLGFALESKFALLNIADTCWLLKSGEWIARHGSLPLHDLFSWTLPHENWVLYQWLSELIFYNIFQVGGLWTLGLVSVEIAALMLFYLLPKDWLDQGVPAAVIPFFLWACLSQYWLLARPQILSLPLLWLFLKIADQAGRGQNIKRLYFLPVLFAIWINLHSFWIFGLLILVFYTVQAWFAQFYKTDWPLHKASLAKTFTIVLLAGIASIFFNPYGLALPVYDFTFYSRVLLSDVTETAPVWSNWQTMPFLLYCAGMTLLLIKGKKVSSPAAISLSFLSMLLALMVQRYMTVAVIISWSCAGPILAALPLGAGTTRKYFFNFAHMAVVATFGLLAWWLACPDESHARDLLLENHGACLDFIVKNRNKTSRLFNDPVIGSWLIYSNAGLVFIDSRQDFYGRKFFHQCLQCENGEGQWDEYLKSFAIDEIAIPDNIGLYWQLLRSPQWLLAFDDGKISYWLKNDSHGLLQLEHWSIEDNQLEHLHLPADTIATLKISRACKHLETGISLCKLQKWRSGRDELQKSLQLLPRSQQALHWFKLANKALEPLKTDAQ